MPVFKLPLSGDVTQSFSPFMGSQFGLVNITLGQSSAPEVEQDMLSDVGTYGKQIGQIADALLVLLENMPAETQHKLDRNDAIGVFKQLMHNIADVKKQHHRPALRPHP
jgi:hypothetical protein